MTHHVVSREVISTPESCMPMSEPEWVRVSLRPPDDSVPLNELFSLEVLVQREWFNHAKLPGKHPKHGSPLPSAHIYFDQGDLRFIHVPCKLSRFRAFGYSAPIDQYSECLDLTVNCTIRIEYNDNLRVVGRILSGSFRLEDVEGALPTAEQFKAFNDFLWPQKDPSLDFIRSLYLGRSRFHIEVAERPHGTTPRRYEFSGITPTRDNSGIGVLWKLVAHPERPELQDPAARLKSLRDKINDVVLKAGLAETIDVLEVSAEAGVFSHIEYKYQDNDYLQPTHMIREFLRPGLRLEFVNEDQSRTQWTPGTLIPHVLPGVEELILVDYDEIAILLETGQVVKEEVVPDLIVAWPGIGKSPASVIRKFPSLSLTEVNPPIERSETSFWQMAFVKGETIKAADGKPEKSSFEHPPAAWIRYKVQPQEDPAATVENGQLTRLRGLSGSPFRFRTDPDQSHAWSIEIDVPQRVRSSRAMGSRTRMRVVFARKSAAKGDKLEVRLEFLSPLVKAVSPRWFHLYDGTLTDPQSLPAHKVIAGMLRPSELVFRHDGFPPEELVRQGMIQSVSEKTIHLSPGSNPAQYEHAYKGLKVKVSTENGIVAGSTLVESYRPGDADIPEEQRYAITCAEDLHLQTDVSYTYELKAEVEPTVPSLTATLNDKKAFRFRCPNGVVTCFLHPSDALIDPVSASGSNLQGGVEVQVPVAAGAAMSVINDPEPRLVKAMEEGEKLHAGLAVELATFKSGTNGAPDRTITQVRRIKESRVGNDSTEVIEPDRRWDPLPARASLKVGGKEYKSVAAFGTATKTERKSAVLAADAASPPLSAHGNAYGGLEITIYDGEKVQSRRIVSYTFAEKKVEVDREWEGTPPDNSTFAIHDAYTIGPWRIVMDRDPNHGFVPVSIREFNVLGSQNASVFPTLEFDTNQVLCAEVSSVMALLPNAEWGPDEADPLRVGSVKLHHRNLVLEHAEFETSFEDRFPSGEQSGTGSTASLVPTAEDFIQAVRDRYTEASGNLIDSNPDAHKLLNWLPGATWIRRQVGASDEVVTPRVDYVPARIGVIENVAASDTEITVTTAANHWLVTDDWVVIQGDGLDAANNDPKHPAWQIVRQTDRVFRFKKEKEGEAKPFRGIWQRAFPSAAVSWRDIHDNPSPDPGKQVLSIAERSKNWLEYDVQPLGSFGVEGKAPKLLVRDTADDSSGLFYRVANSSAPVIFAPHGITAVACDAGDVIFAGTAQGTVTFWKLESEQWLSCSASQHEGQITSVDLRWLDGTKYLALSTGKDGKVLFWEIDAAGAPNSIGPATGPTAVGSEICAGCLAFTGTKEALFGVNDSQTGKGSVWEAKESTAKKLVDFDEGITSLATFRTVARDLEFLVTGHPSGKWQLWQRDAGTLKKACEGSASAAISVTALAGKDLGLPTKKQLAVEAGYADGRVGIWHPIEKKGGKWSFKAANPRWVRQASPVTSVTLLNVVNIESEHSLAGISTPRDYILAAGEDGLARLWDIRFAGIGLNPEETEEVRSFRTDSGRITSVGTWDNPDRVIAATNRGQIQIWDLKTGKELPKCPALPAAQYSYDNLGVMRGREFTETDTWRVRQATDGEFPGLLSISAHRRSILVDPPDQQNRTDIIFSCLDLKVRSEGTVPEFTAHDARQNLGVYGFRSSVQCDEKWDNLKILDRWPRLCGMPVCVTRLREFKLNKSKTDFESIAFEAVPVNPDDVAVCCHEKGMPSFVRDSLSMGSVITVTVTRAGQVTVKKGDSLHWTFAVNRQIPLRDNGFPGRLAGIQGTVDIEANKLTVKGLEGKAVIFERLWKLEPTEVPARLQGAGTFSTKLLQAKCPGLTKDTDTVLKLKDVDESVRSREFLDGWVKIHVIKPSPTQHWRLIVGHRKKKDQGGQVIHEITIAEPVTLGAEETYDYEIFCSTQSEFSFKGGGNTGLPESNLVVSSSLNAGPAFYLGANLKTIIADTHTIKAQIVSLEEKGNWLDLSVITKDQDVLKAVAHKLQGTYYGFVLKPHPRDPDYSSDPPPGQNALLLWAEGGLTGNDNKLGGILIDESMEEAIATDLVPALTKPGIQLSGPQVRLRVISSQLDKSGNVHWVTRNYVTWHLNKEKDGLALYLSDQLAVTQVAGGAPESRTLTGLLSWQTDQGHFVQAPVRVIPDREEGLKKLRLKDDIFYARLVQSTTAAAAREDVIFPFGKVAKKSLELTETVPDVGIRAGGVVTDARKVGPDKLVQITFEDASRRADPRAHGPGEHKKEAPPKVGGVVEFLDVPDDLRIWEVKAADETKLTLAASASVTVDQLHAFQGKTWREVKSAFVHLTISPQGPVVREIPGTHVPVDLVIEPEALADVPRLPPRVPHLIHRRVYGPRMRMSFSGEEHESFWDDDLEKEIYTFKFGKQSWLLGPLSVDDDRIRILSESLLLRPISDPDTAKKYRSEDLLILRRSASTAPTLTAASDPVGSILTTTSEVDPAGHALKPIFTQTRIRDHVLKTGSSGVVLVRALPPDTTEPAYRFFESPFFEYAGEQTTASVTKKPIDAEGHWEKQDYSVDFRLLLPEEVGHLEGIETRNSYRPTRPILDPLRQNPCAPFRVLAYRRETSDVTTHSELTSDLETVPTIQVQEATAFRCMEPLFNVPECGRRIAKNDHLFLPPHLETRFGPDKPGAMLHHKLHAFEGLYNPKRATWSWRPEPMVDTALRDPQHIKVDGCVTASIENLRATRKATATFPKDLSEITVRWDEVIGQVELGDLGSKVQIVGGGGKFELQGLEGTGERPPAKLIVQFNEDLIEILEKDYAVPGYEILTEASQPSKAARAPKAPDDNILYIPSRVFLAANVGDLAMPRKVSLDEVEGIATLFHPFVAFQEKGDADITINKVSGKEIEVTLVPKRDRKSKPIPMPKPKAGEALILEDLKDASPDKADFGQFSGLWQISQDDGDQYTLVAKTSSDLNNLVGKATVKWRRVFLFSTCFPEITPPTTSPGPYWWELDAKALPSLLWHPSVKFRIAWGGIVTKTDHEGKKEHTWFEAPLFKTDKFFKFLSPSAVSPKIAAVLSLKARNGTTAHEILQRTVLFGNSASATKGQPVIQVVGQPRFRFVVKDNEEHLTQWLPQAFLEAPNQNKGYADLFLIKYMVNGQTIFQRSSVERTASKNRPHRRR
jgi:WD40 repeat protein